MIMLNICDTGEDFFFGLFFFDFNYWSLPPVLLDFSDMYEGRKHLGANFYVFVVLFSACVST